MNVPYKKSKLGLSRTTAIATVYYLLPGGGKRKPSFKMVSNMVIQLLHTIKFSMEVPFSNMTQQPVEMQKTMTTKKVENILTQIKHEF